MIKNNDYPESDWDCQNNECGRNLQDWFSENTPCSLYGGESFKCPHCGTVMEVEFDETWDGEEERHYYMLRLSDIEPNDIKADAKHEKAIEDMKNNFPKVFGMTYEEFEKRISTPKMKVLVDALREKFLYSESDAE